MSDPLARKSLARYFAITENKKMAKFLIARKVRAEFSGAESLEALWLQHAKCTEEYLSLESQIDNGKNYNSIVYPEQSYLSLKICLAKKILECCHFCSRRCGVNRLADQLGFCGCGKNMAVSSIFAHMGEEPELVPSGTVFTMGCTIRCRHCQNWTISQWKEAPIEYKPEELAVEVENLHREGCRNVNLVGGEPTPWLMHWLETFQACRGKCACGVELQQLLQPRNRAVAGGICRRLPVGFQVWTRRLRHAGFGCPQLLAGVHAQPFGG